MLRRLRYRQWHTSYENLFVSYLNEQTFQTKFEVLGYAPSHSRLWKYDSRKFNSTSAKVESTIDNWNSHELKAVTILDYSDRLSEIPLCDVRNFCFIAHVDHGKSSLASRVLELTGNLGPEGQGVALQFASLTKSEISNQQQPTSIHAKKKEQIQLLDTLSVEQERGITVKASAASMLYFHECAQGPLKLLLLNMVDTPGHADFGFEVTRSLRCVQGAVLLFDAAQGVQAQTLSVYEKARALGVTLIPALTKVDLDSAKPEDVALSVSELFSQSFDDPDAVLWTSARSRIGIRQVLDAVATQVPAPPQLLNDIGNSLCAHVIDSWFEPLRGVVCLLQILSGSIEEGDRVSVLDPKTTYQGEHFSVQDLGLVLPHRIRTKKLSRGHMGYAIVGLRDPRQARPGSFVVLHKDVSGILLGGLLHEAATTKDSSSSILANQQSALYASVHPMEGDSFDEMCAIIDKAALNDTGLEVTRTSGSGSSQLGGPHLGPGLRVGFQGLLHVEVFRQRLLDEFGLEVIVTPPKVPYMIKYLPSSKGQRRPADAPMELIVEDLSQWPDGSERFEVREPMVNMRIMAPMQYAGQIMELIQRNRGKDMETKPMDQDTWLFTSKMPWGEVVTDFHDDLKNITAGYGSFDTTEAEPVKADLVKVDLCLNGDVVDPLAFVCHKDDAQRQARTVCQKLQQVLPRQQFVIAIQAKVGTKVIASERIRAYRKDVLTKAGKTVGGGDITRKKKLLEKQKAGKKRQQASGKVTLTQDAFNSVITRSTN